MRLPRQLLLPTDSGFAHKIWRAHNKEYLLHDERVKKDYLTCLFNSLSHRSVNNTVKIHAYCIMSNHVHELTSYTNTSESLSTHMRLSHSKFGMIFNKKNNRQGPVAYDRPKTPFIEPNDLHLMRVHFYIESNPLRAGIVRNLKLFRYSSFKFYAYGITDEFTSQLEIPEWYKNLGDSNEIRQRNYRRLFYQYLKELRERDPRFTRLRFIGDESWVIAQEIMFKEKIKLNNKSPPT